MQHVVRNLEPPNHYSELGELLEHGPAELPIEREVLRCLENSRLLTSFRVINGLQPDNLRAFLEGRPVGTLVHKSGAEVKP